MDAASFGGIVFHTKRGRTRMQSANRVSASVLRRMYKDDTLCDVTLCGVPAAGVSPTSLRPIKAYKNILAHASSHLYALFTVDGYVDSHQSHYNIQNVDHESLRRIVEFIHLDELVMDEKDAVDVVCGVLVAAKYLVMKDPLADACESFLAESEQVKPENCVKLWCFARKHSCLALMEVTSKFIAEHLHDMPKSDEFLSMPFADCAKLLLSEAFVTADADTRCRAAFAWLDHGRDGSRSMHVHDVLNMVPFISGPLLFETLLIANKYEILLKNAPDSIRLAMVNTIGKKIKLDYPTLPGVALSDQSTSNGVWYIIGGHGNTTSFLKYDVSGRVWTTLPALPWHRERGAACAVGNRVFVMGGLKNASTSSDIDEYDVTNSSWSTSLAKLSEARRNFVACYNNQDAYALGGYRDSGRLDVVERYSTGGFGRIAKLAALPSKRDDFSASFSTVHNAILVAGGNTGIARESRIDKYDVLAGQWTKVGQMTRGRVALASAIVGNYDELYLIGGYENIVGGYGQALNLVEIFNIRTGQIRAGPSLLKARSACSAVTLSQGNVVAVLGDFASRSRAVEAYDVREGKWSTGVIVPDMPVACEYSFGFAAV